MASTISFTNDKVGLIVRGKTSHAHEPGVMEQHADAILADGTPVGFFGEGDGTSGSGGSLGFGMTGVVADVTWFKRFRPYYVNATKAKGVRMYSTVLLVDCTATEANLFKDYWDKLRLKPGSFTLLGDNCSTHASEAFTYAGITGGGIPGLDTPNNLYRQIYAVRKKTATYAGFIGFTKNGTGYDLVIET